MDRKHTLLKIAQGSKSATSFFTLLGNTAAAIDVLRHLMSKQILSCKWLQTPSDRTFTAAVVL